MEYKCSNCGGELQFDPTIGKLKCPYCGKVYELEEYENDGHDHDHAHEHEHDHEHSHEHDHIEDHSHAAIMEEKLPEGAPKPSKSTDGTTDVQDDLVIYSCPHCGAEIVTDKTTSATTCLFCKTPLVIEQQTSGKFRPKYIVPFEVDKRRIGELYEQYIAGKPFFPEEYSSENVINKIQGIYLPYWLYDMRVRGSLLASGEHTTSFRAGKYMVTDHRVYHIQREGDMDFWKVPVVASSKASEEAMDALEPYDYNKLAKYNPGYLPGFLAQRYDQESSERAKRCGERAEESFNNRMISTMSGYEGLHIIDGHMEPKLVAADYAMLPAYLLYLDYDNAKGEDGLIAINGQTGKIVGNIPVDNRKRTLYFLTRFLMVFLIAFAIMMAIFIMID